MSAALYLDDIRTAGYEAAQRGQVAAPILSSTVQLALAGRAVGDPEVKSILRAFTAGYEKHRAEQIAALENEKE